MTDGIAAVDAAAQARLRAVLETPGAMKVRGAMAAAGVPLRLVGGSVRDALLGLPVKDVDLCTPAPPERVRDALLAAGGIKVIPTGIEHGTLTAVAFHQPFEITSLRRDVKTDGRRAVVVFTDDWREDAARRDFTINAMSATADLREKSATADLREKSATADWNGDGHDDPINVYDYFGGIADLAAGRVRFVGDATTRLTEDVLRLLRFYRFFARYGQGAPDEAALAACRAMAHLLPGLSAERVRAEILRLLEAPAAAAAWRRMADADGVLEPLGLRPADSDKLQRIIDLQAALNEPPDPFLRFIAACPADAPRAAALAERLRLSNAEKARWRAAAELVPLCPAVPDRDFLYQCGALTTFNDALRLTAAARGADAAWIVAAQAAAGNEIPRLPVTGKDLLKIGAAPGPALGDALKQIENWWRAAGFAPDHADCLAHAARLLKQT